MSYYAGPLDFPEAPEGWVCTYANPAARRVAWPRCSGWGVFLAELDPDHHLPACDNHLGVVVGAVLEQHPGGPVLVSPNDRPQR